MIRNIDTIENCYGNKYRVLYDGEVWFLNSVTLPQPTGDKLASGYYSLDSALKLRGFTKFRREALVQELKERSS